METLKYKVIKTKKQYNDYCRILHDLDFSTRKKTICVREEMDLITVLIEKYDQDHNIFNELDPVQLLRSLMNDHQFRSVDLANELKVSPGLISDILNYKKGFSKDIIRKLAVLFKVSQEAFNRHYPLLADDKSHSKKTIKLVPKKKLAIRKF